MTFHLKKKITIKIELYAATGFISNDISFEKQSSHYKNETLHN